MFVVIINSGFDKQAYWSIEGKTPCLKIALNIVDNRSLLDVRAKRGAGCFSDHHLLIASIRLKVAAIRRPETSARKYDVRNLLIPARRELKEGLNVERAHPVTEWPNIQAHFEDAARVHIGYRTPRKKQWISDDTWYLIQSRRDAKSKLNAARTRSEKVALREVYSQQDKQNSEGVLTTSRSEQLEIWRQHYSRLLSNPPFATESICTCTSHCVRQDIQIEAFRAVSALKANKAPGADNIAPEMLKADSQTSSSFLQPLIQTFWSTNELDARLKEGIIVNIPKKGDLMECKNWRGIQKTKQNTQSINKIHQTNTLPYIRFYANQ
ncbi:uncharacterized protein LOC135950630 [Calliphora vicina]|uniref:uncharacterized protein LOC135950630 n=1 Tax=Calliphora vicina TaxID=7373 RepID=UPI00325BFC5F